MKLYYSKAQLAKKKQSEEREITPESANNTKDESDALNIDHYDIDESGTMFEEAISQLRTLQNNMITVLVKYVAAQFITKSDSYKKER